MFEIWLGIFLKYFIWTTVFNWEFLIFAISIACFTVYLKLRKNRLNRKWLAFFIFIYFGVFMVINLSVTALVISHTNGFNEATEKKCLSFANTNQETVIFSLTEECFSGDLPLRQIELDKNQSETIINYLSNH